MAARLDGKVAVITGAASGIGLATLERFVEEGARVVAADVDRDAGGTLEQRFGAAVRFAACDVRELDQLRTAIDLAADRFGGLDILFNNAGRGGAPAGVEDFDPLGWDDTFAMLLRAVAAGTSYAVPHMKRRGGGAVVNTASIAALQAGFGPVAYSVAKAGVVHYTRVAAARLAPLRIRVNAVAPGFIATSIFGGLLGLDADQSRQLAGRVAEHSGVVNPLGRSGRPRDIADAVLYLASDEAGFVTGTQLTVDGGLTVGPRSSWDPTAEPLLASSLTEAQRAALAALAAQRKP